MLEHWESLTKKYALAFINLYGKQLSDKNIDNVIACKHYIEGHKNIDAFLLLSTIQLEQKTELFKNLFAFFDLPQSFNNLVLTLLEHRRIELLSKILQKIAREYQAQKNIINFTVHTSHTINDQEKKELTTFIQKKVPKNIIVEFALDPALICGIKIKSDMLQWERSIAKQLKIIKLDALQQVQL